MRHSIEVFLTVSALGCFAQTPAVPAAVFGQVLDTAGKPAAAVGLALVSQYDGKAGFQPVKMFGATTNAGYFDFEPISPGKYKVCLDPRRGEAANEFLDPCTWTPEATVVSPAAGSRVQMAITVTRSATLRVLVDDPGKHLDKNKGKTKDADFDLGVLTAAGLWVPARLKSSKVDGEEYEFRLAPGVAHRLIGHSKFFVMEDERGPGAAKKDGVDLPVQANARVSRAVAPAPVVLKITGLKGK